MESSAAERLSHLTWLLSKRFRSIRWAWQRLTRGWDDRAIWSIDHWLAKNLSEMLPELAKVSHGWPAVLVNQAGLYKGLDPSFTFEDWQKELRKAGALFGRVAAEDYGDYTLAEKEHKEAFEWLAKRAGALWD